MIHYTCDRCQRKIDTDQDTLFQLRIEIRSISPPEPTLDPDEMAAREFMELEDTIDDMAVSEGEEVPPVSQLHFDLCADCFVRYAQDPLAKNSSELGFSKN